MMTLKSEHKQLTSFAYHATHLDHSNKSVSSEPLWIQSSSLLIATVQKVFVTGNDIIWVVFLPLDTKIIAASIQLQ